MADVELPRQRLSGERLAEDVQGAGGLGAPFDHAVDAKLFVGIGLGDLPPSGAADDHLVVRAVRVGLDRGEQQTRIVGVDGLFGGAEDRRVDAGGKRHTERVVRRHGDHSGVGPDELVDVVGETHRDVANAELADQRRLEHADAGRHVARRSVGVVLELAPLRILPVQHAFEPYRQRRHAHLDEVAGVIDDLCQGSRDHDSRSAAVIHSSEAVSASALAVVMVLP